MSKDVNFEESMKELENIVRTLESDNVSLDESIKLFEKGVKLSDVCSKLLDNATQKVKIVTKNSNGEEVIEDFNN